MAIHHLKPSQSLDRGVVFRLFLLCNSNAQVNTMPADAKLLAVILGGGAGTRLFPLTQQRSKPAVPLGGKYRLVDIAISNCINSDILRMFVLTQHNSASLNRHIAQTYRFSQFSNGFVVILCDAQSASEFGLLKTDPEGRIIEFKEKPKGEDLLAMQVDTKNMGLSA